MPSGSELVSRIAATGIDRRFASLMASASLLVSITKIRSGTPPMSLMPPSAFSSFSRSRDIIRRSFLVRPEAAPPVELVVDLAQALDRGRDRLPVGQHAAEPTRVDVILRRALGGIGDLLLRLALGADEQHATAAGHRVRDRLQRLVHQRHRLREVDDVDVVARAEDVGPHLGVPAVRLMTEVGAGLEEPTHGEIGKCHRPVILRLRPPRIG